MKTKNVGQGFEIDNSHIGKSKASAVLRRIPGVEGVRTHTLWDEIKGDEIRVSFTYRGVACMIWEPFGDNSRFWIGPVGEDVVDIAPIEAAFSAHKPLIPEELSARLWYWLAVVVLGLVIWMLTKC